MMQLKSLFHLNLIARLNHKLSNENQRKPKNDLFWKWEHGNRGMKRRSRRIKTIRRKMIVKCLFLGNRGGIENYKWTKSSWWRALRRNRYSLFDSECANDVGIATVDLGMWVRYKGHKCQRKDALVSQLHTCVCVYIWNTG